MPLFSSLANLRIRQPFIFRAGIGNWPALPEELLFHIKEALNLIFQVLIDHFTAGFLGWNPFVFLLIARTDPLHYFGIAKRNTAVMLILFTDLFLFFISFQLSVTRGRFFHIASCTETLLGRPKKSALIFFCKVAQRQRLLVWLSWPVWIVVHRLLCS